MKKPTIRCLLPFLLACVLLAQVAVGVAGWHIDVPSVAQNSQVAHCITLEPHTAGEHHHNCCHTTPGNVPVASLALPQVESVKLISAFFTQSYRNPHTDLLIRPPIA
ncbi:hypothetical protein [Thiothrix lacustris]|jgi:hypothetical protein|uniref:hypothetical protein n=1 Tax=Thiothrix lacustris TaxID=525917 RepID=UPI0004919A11|nr:hypothetical protein [Thiothrix lacustris]